MRVVNIYKLDENARTPFKGTEKSSCHDINACFHKEYVNFYNHVVPIRVENFGNNHFSYIKMKPNDIALIPTGLIFCLPKTHHLKFYSRSGNVWKKMMVVANQPAVIDSDYVKESFVLLHNKSDKNRIVMDGSAIAQCELCINNNINFNDFDEEEFELFKAHMANISSRDGGFGSTDK